MKEHVIITGANGYVGRYVVQEAMKNFKVIALKYSHFRSTLVEGVDYHFCDITKIDETKLKSLIKGKKIAAIIHLAAILGESSYDKNYEVNAKGTQNLIDFAKKNKIKRFIYLSTVTTLKKIKGPYGKTKKIGEDYTRKSNLDYTIFIPALILGPESLGINRILKNMYRFPLTPMIGSGKYTQHPIFVKDLAKMIVECIKNKKTFRKTYQTAGDTVISFRDFVELIMETKKKQPIIPLPFGVAMTAGKIFEKMPHPVFTSEHVKGLVQDSRLDTQQLKKDTGFKPTPLKDALEYSLARIKNHNENLKPRRELRIRH